MLYFYIFSSPLDLITVQADSQGICGIWFKDQKNRPLDLGICDARHDWLCLARDQILQYLACERQVFDLPLSFYAKGFTLKAQKALLQIPYGATLSYQDLAIKLDCPKAYRAVGTAISKNPLSVVVPCHRVLGKTSLGGYAGGLDRKKFLLDLEKGFAQEGQN